MSMFDDLFKDMLANTDVTRLKNAGKPLDLGDDPHTPDDLKLAYKMLRDNDMIPDWILEARELDDTRGQLISRIQAARRVGTVSAALRDDVTQFNKRILSFNLKVPAGVKHKLFVDIERELARAT
jgi:hypothetical protein